MDGSAAALAGEGFFAVLARRLRFMTAEERPGVAGAAALHLEVRRLAVALAHARAKGSARGRIVRQLDHRKLLGVRREGGRIDRLQFRGLSSAAMSDRSAPACRTFPASAVLADR